jgi:hypothetical protein
MAATSFVPKMTSGRRLRLADIDAAVAARLGPTRGLGNSQPACFNRQVAMYLAKHVGGWSTTIIGRFYNGRDHSTVCYGIQRIQSLRDSDPEVDALIVDLRRSLDQNTPDAGLIEIKKEPPVVEKLSRKEIEELAEEIVQKMIVMLGKRSEDQTEC